MQKLMNAPERFVDEMLEGILAAHPDQLRLAGDPRAIVRVGAPIPGRVAIVTGGGSGHLPVFLGFVGPGLADGVAVGNVFASPSAKAMLAVMRAVEGGAGVLQLYGNYGGDIMNFDLASELARDEGMEVETVLGADDVASAPRGGEARRRGVAGIAFLYKVAGAAADAGASLGAVRAVVERAAANVRTMGVALSPCTIPEVGRATFELPEGQMEIGMGIHGEPGVRRGPLMTADAVADELLGTILEDMPVGHGERVAVLVNGLGATPREELYILYRRIHAVLGERGIAVHRAMVGEYATSLEMAGASITLMRLDDELAGYLDAPASSPLFARP